jgi:hypothetical protein
VENHLSTEVKGRYDLFVGGRTYFDKRKGPFDCNFNEHTTGSKDVWVGEHYMNFVDGDWYLETGAKCKVPPRQDLHGDLNLIVGRNRVESVKGDSDLKVQGDHRQQIDGTVSLTVGGDQHTKVGGNIAQEAGAAGAIHLKAGMNVVIEAGAQLSLVGPGGFINIGPDGISIEGQLVKINSGGAAGSGIGCKPQKPRSPKQARPTEPAMGYESTTGHKSAPD